MKKSCFLICAVFCILAFAACGKGNDNREKIEDADSFDEKWEEELSKIDLRDILTDNTKDSFYAIVRQWICKEEEEYSADSYNSSEVGIATKNGAFFFYRHYDISQNGEQITAKTKNNYYSFNANEDEVFVNEGFDLYSNVLCIGGCEKEENVIALCVEYYEDKGNIWHAVELNDKAEVVNDTVLTLNFPSNIWTNPIEVRKDSDGVIHYLQQEWPADDDVQDLYKSTTYYCINTDGIIFRYENSNNKRLVSLSDGKVGIIEKVDAETGEQILFFDGNKEELVSIAGFPQEVSYEEAAFDGSWIFSDSSGIFDIDEYGEKEYLYRFINHGICLKRMHDLFFSDNKINLVYEDESGINYLQLIPTTGSEEPLAITMAVMPSSKKYYQAAVDEFNRRYPCYFLKLDSDQSIETVQLNAVKKEGPVLIETNLLSFDKNKKLLMPLNSVMDWIKEENECVEKALDLGKLDDIQYAVPSQFTIQIMMTQKDSAKDWDYDEFWKCFDESGAKAITNFEQNVGILFVKNFLIHGEDDSYFWDKDKGETYFAKKKEILELIKNNISENADIEQGTDLLTGKLFCNQVRLGRPGSLELVRYYFDDDYKMIGYPCKEGANFLLQDITMAAVRANASLEEKKAACLFLKVLLSYNAQRFCVEDSTAYMSINRQVFDEQCRKYVHLECPNAQGLPFVPIREEKFDPEWVTQEINEIIEGAAPKQKLPAELESILDEELWPYFENQQDLKNTVKNLDNRISLYFSE